MLDGTSELTAGIALKWFWRRVGPTRYPLAVLNEVGPTRYSLAVANTVSTECIYFFNAEIVDWKCKR